MAIRHVVMFRWKEGVPAEHVVAAGRELANLPALVPTIRKYVFGPDLAVNPGNFDYVVVADFDDVDGYLAYRDHPDHKKFIAAYTADFVAERAAIQYEIG